MYADHLGKILSQPWITPEELDWMTQRERSVINAGYRPARPAESHGEPNRSGDTLRKDVPEGN